ncbi:Scr1 family TA system antitoxin-like transcriptional regulator [Peterkaempfera sp. SMS 1(5)a]|uniref:helix-turn-helix domain-containing protein n=1 Tax=Peterkaempfera podocarpi TaxID=3232308 RepID=UPI00366FB9DD
MAARPRELKPGRSARDFYGAEVRRLRTEAGLSLVQLAGVLNYSKSHLANIETADRVVPPDLSAKLDAAFGTGGHFVRLYPLARREAHPDKYRRFMELEAQASSVAEYAAHTVPGLLQTEEYARALLRFGTPDGCDDRLEEKVCARLGRQERLRGEEPPYLWAVLDEVVLRRPIGGPAVMRDQLAALLPLVDTATTKIQVLPFAHGAHFQLGCSLTLHTMPGGSRYAYLEGSDSGQLLEDPSAVAERTRAYDVLRACALSPRDSAAFIRSAMEGHPPCVPPRT